MIGTIYWLISSILAPEKWKSLPLPCFLENRFLSVSFTIESPSITQYLMAKKTDCLFLLVGFCLHFCLEDYRIVLNLCYFCHSLKIGTYGQRCEDFQKIINVCFRRVVAGDIYTTKFDDKFSWLVCTANSLRIRSIESITKATYFSLHLIVTVNFVFRANYCFEKFNFFFKCGNYYFIKESLIFFFVVHILLQFNI